MSSWIVDLLGSFTVGPFLFEARGVYTPGNKARDNLAQSNPLLSAAYHGRELVGGLGRDPGSGVDYFNGSLLTNQARFIGYDRYGSARAAFRATYNITPALALWGIASPSWTAEKVDTDTGASPGLGTGSITRTTIDDQSWVKGDSRYIGTETDLGLTWRFAPNAAFDLEGSYLFAGAALGTAEVVMASTRAVILTTPTNWRRASGSRSSSTCSGAHEKGPQDEREVPRDDGKQELSSSFFLTQS